MDSDTAALIQDTESLAQKQQHESDNTTTDKSAQQLSWGVKVDTTTKKKHTRDQHTHILVYFKSCQKSNNR